MRPQIAAALGFAALIAFAPALAQTASAPGQISDTGSGSASALLISPATTDQPASGADQTPPISAPAAAGESPLPEKGNGGITETQEPVQPAAQTSQPSASETTNAAGPFRRIRLAQVPGAPQGPVVVVPVMVPQQQGFVRRHRFKGFLGKIFGPILSPVTEGLDDTATGLENTAAGLRGIEQPLYDLSTPLNGLANPLNGLAQPMTNLAQPMTNLAQPIDRLATPIHQLQPPMNELSHSLAGLSKPMGSLGRDMLELRQPLTGMQKPMYHLAVPIDKLATPIYELQDPLIGLQRPLTDLAGPIDRLQNQLNGLRGQLMRIEQVVLDLSRNVTLAIIFGSIVIAYAIWSYQKVPPAAQPTVTTIEHPGGSHSVMRTTPTNQPPLPPTEQPPPEQGPPLA